MSTRLRWLFAVLGLSALTWTARDLWRCHEGGGCHRMTHQELYGFVEKGVRAGLNECRGAPQGVTEHE